MIEQIKERIKQRLKQAKERYEKWELTTEEYNNCVKHWRKLLFTLEQKKC